MKNYSPSVAPVNSNNQAPLSPSNARKVQPAPHSALACKCGHSLIDIFSSRNAVHSCEFSDVLEAAGSVVHGAASVGTCATETAGDNSQKPSFLHSGACDNNTGEPISSPVSNTGGKSSYQGIQPSESLYLLEDLDDTSERPGFTLGQNGKAKLFWTPNKDTSVKSDAALHDWLGFTIRSSGLARYIYNNSEMFEGLTWLSLPESHINGVNGVLFILHHCFGFSTAAQKSRGMNHYQYSYDVEGLATISIGGQADTINLQVTGQGLRNSKQGWQQRLFNVIQELGVDAWLTRVDLFQDYFKGEYNPKIAALDYEQGKFTTSGRPPKATIHGMTLQDWKAQDFEWHGKTFNVGSRKSGKICRVYHKYAEIMGNMTDKEKLELPKDHPIFELYDWCRMEVEWHNKDRVIPKDILLHPGQYLAGAYPAISFVDAVQESIKTISKTAVLKLQHIKDVIRKQFGVHLSWLVKIHGIEVINELLRDGKRPAWVADVVVNEFGDYVIPVMPKVRGTFGGISYY